MAKIEQGGDAASAKPKTRSGLALPISMLLVTIVAAAAGMAVVWMVKPGVGSAEKSETRTTAAAGAKRTTQLLELPSIIGQVGDRKTWVRTDLSVVVPAEPPLTSADAALLADDYLAYIQSLSFEDLTTQGGLRILREDLEERARIRFRAKSAQVVFRSMVVE